MYNVPWYTDQSIELFATEIAQDADPSANPHLRDKERGHATLKRKIETLNEETQQIMTAIAIVSANCILNVSDGNEGLIEANCDTLRTQILNMCMQTVRRTKH